MVEIVEGGRAALRRFARGSCSCSSRARSACSLPLFALALASTPARTVVIPSFVFTPSNLRHPRVLSVGYGEDGQGQAQGSWQGQGC